MKLINLPEFTADRGLSYTKLSELSGVSKVTISAIVNGKNCNPETAHKIATALGVAVKELIKNEKEN